MIVNMMRGTPGRRAQPMSRELPMCVKAAAAMDYIILSWHRRRYRRVARYGHGRGNDLCSLYRTPVIIHPDGIIGGRMMKPGVQLQAIRELKPRRTGP